MLMAFSLKKKKTRNLKMELQKWFHERRNNNDTEEEEKNNGG